MMITARNYAAQAEKDLLEYVKSLKKLGPKFIPEAAESVQEIEDVAHKIGNAIHFALPDNGRVLNDGLRGINGALVRLPYPAITVEYFCKEAPLTKEHPFSMPKRLCLASEIEINGKMFVDMYVVGFSAEDKQWFPQSIGFRIDLNEPIETVKEGILIAGEPLLLNAFSFDVSIAQFGKAVAFKNAYHDVQDEMFAVMELIEALSCSNVKTQLLDPVDALKQARRANDGKLPIYETKILTIPGSLGSGEHLGGTHSGPRQHLRRGHIRRLPVGNIWVNSHLVGDPSKGKIEKSYQLAE
jgi:hypothetical protein